MSLSSLKLSAVVPRIYNNFVSTKVLGLDVTETKATCDNCLRSRDKRFTYTYKSNLKCCTFHPYTPNYAIGALLSSQEATVGIEKIKSKIQNREFAFPIGIMAPFDYQYLFLTKEEEQFGNDENLLCPYFDKLKNMCSIWQYRGVVCTSFYCRSDYGQDGQKFWAVLSDYLSYVEMALAEECLVQLDFSPRDLSDQLIYLNKREFEQEETEQKCLTPDVDKSLWNGYDDKIEFYKKCFALVQKIDRTQFKEIMGHQGIELEKEVIEYAKRR
ncbi:hypothetical protein K2P97_03020 [bacterium]|nr:hypothetical protein [bacterium]